MFANLRNTVVTAYLSRRMPHIAKWVLYPVVSQEQVFNHLIASAKQTAWGKQYHYKSIENIADFQRQVPLSDYDRLKPFINQMLNGEANTLWPGEIRWFAKSSGTTSDKSKFIPISSENLKTCHYQAAIDIMALYIAANPKHKIYTGKGLVLGGSHSINKLNPRVQYGDLSAVLLQNMPSVGRINNAIGTDIALMDEWIAKIERMAKATIPQNITHLAGVPTWTIVLIKRIFEMTGKANLRDVWPNLELYIHGGVSFTPYRNQFSQLVRGEGMHYWQTYNASEGFFGIQEDNNRDDMLLLTNHGVFYEFVPLNQLDAEHPQALTLDQVQINTNYAICISTNTGLWRYLLGDTIQFTSINPFRIKVTGRTKHFINAFGEEVIVDNADQAIARACAQTGMQVREYTAAPIYFSNTGNGGHEWLVEFAQLPDDLQYFAQLTDEALQQLNSDYEAKRYKNIAMKPLVMHAVPPGTFYKWLESKGKLGGQHKVPRLANHRQYIDEIKTLCGLN